MGALREITSPSNPAIKGFRALHLKKRREETGLFLAEGARVVIEALDCGVAPETLIYAKTERAAPVVASLRERALAAGADAVEVSGDILEKLARKDNPQSVLGVFRQRMLRLVDLDARAAGVFVALDGVKDPGNLGTIIRTVDAVGGGGVILVGQTCDPFSVETVRATMGSLFAVPLARATTEAFVAFCKRWPGPVVGTALQTNNDYRAVRYAAPTLLVMGAEQSGLSEPVRAACTTLVKMPMRGRADSLNLAVSTGVMLYRILDDQAPFGA